MYTLRYKCVAKYYHILNIDLTFHNKLQITESNFTTFYNSPRSNSNKITIKLPTLNVLPYPVVQFSEY